MWQLEQGLNTINLKLLLTFKAAKLHVKVSEVIPALLASKLGQHQAGLKGWWLLNTALCSLALCRGTDEVFEAATSSMEDAVQLANHHP